MIVPQQPQEARGSHSTEEDTAALGVMVSCLSRQGRQRRPHLLTPASCACRQAGLRNKPTGPAQCSPREAPRPTTLPTGPGGVPRQLGSEASVPGTWQVHGGG